MALIPAESGSSSDTHHWKYDVFLSFCAVDTRKSSAKKKGTLKTFVSDLYAALKQKGLSTFCDERLEKGPTWDEQLKAIRISRMSVVILSRNYISSTKCLNELVMILKCKKEREHIVFPVFCHVHPSYLRFEKINYVRFEDNLEKVQQWRAALTEVSSLSGWDFQDG